MPRLLSSIAVLGLCASAATGPQSAAADRLYSIDVLGNTLVQLGPDTGTVEVVGFIDFAGFVTFDLAYHDGLLYALSQFGSVHELHSIDPASAALGASVPVTLDGQPIGRATGLAERDGHLLIGFTPDIAASRATHIGRLDVDGTITDVIDFSSFNAEFHGLAVTPDGATMFSIDSGFTNDLYQTTVAPQSHAFVGGGGFSAVNDLVFRDTDLWGLSSVAQDFSSLVRLDATTGAVLQMTAIDVLPGQSLFTGLAHVPCSGDVDESSDVNFDDLLAVLATWGPCPGCPGDIDHDGVVGFADLLAVLAAWGEC